MVVEQEHLGDEPGPQSKRQSRHHLHGFAGRPLHQHIALECSEPARSVLQPRMEAVVQLVTRDDIDADMSHKVMSTIIFALAELPELPSSEGRAFAFDLIESLEVAIERRGCRGFIGLDKFDQPPELLRRATSRHDDG